MAIRHVADGVDLGAIYNHEEFLRIIDGFERLFEPNSNIPAERRFHLARLYVEASDFKSIFRVFHPELRNFLVRFGLEQVPMRDSLFGQELLLYLSFLTGRF